MMEFCTSISLSIIFIGSVGNWLCICVFVRKRFRTSILTPFFIALLIADSIYLIFRVIKIFYYEQTLFKRFLSSKSCASSFLTQSFGYFTQHAPQMFIPFAHYEFYIRFSLLLMSFLAVQRAYDICKPSNRFVTNKSSSRYVSYLLIAIALFLSYLFEFFGLSIFCSKELSPTLAYQWYNHLRQNLTNETSNFFSFLKNQSASTSEIECLIKTRPECPEEDVTRIVQYYFDMHQRPIVALIHKIELSTLGTKMARNELRLKYHYHSCPIRLDPDVFLNIYNLLYSRLLALNRYTIILVLGSILPSLIAILSNIASLQSIISIRKAIDEEFRASRHRAEETRRVAIIITIECLLAILSSWFVDVVLSVKHCGGSVALADDCPHFLRHSQLFFACCDLLNSMSNIVLYCFAGRRFRDEFRCMLDDWFHCLRRCIPCYCRIEWRGMPKFPTTYAEQYMIQISSSNKLFGVPLSHSRPKQKYVQIQMKTLT